MKHRILNLYLIMGLSLIFSPLGMGQALFQEGVDYKVRAGLPSSTLELKEFFSYNCPHCYEFDSVIAGYLKSAPEEYSFKRIPVSFGRDTWKKSAQVYTLAQFLSLKETLHTKIFERIHKEHKPFKNDQDIKDFFIANGVTEERFNKISNSFALKSRYKSNELLNKKYSISSVPTLIVRDVYQIELRSVKNSAKLRQLVDYLMRL